jgi:hypothetical protein
MNAVMKYQTLVVSIKSFEERKDSKGKDTSTYLIGGSQTVQNCQDLRTCYVQF